MDRATIYHDTKEVLLRDFQEAVAKREGITEVCLKLITLADTILQDDTVDFMWDKATIMKETTKQYLEKVELGNGNPMAT